MPKEDLRLQEMISSLRTRILVMCAESSLVLERTQQILQSGDAEKAKAIIDGDATINALENEIDDRALSILVRSQPMASDLRFVMSSLRIITDLERICDEAVSIAQHILLMKDTASFQVMEEVLSLMGRTQEAFNEAVAAFRDNDTEKAVILSQNEAKAAQAEVEVLQKTIERFGKAEGKSAEFVVRIILIVHSLTRIWQRSVNIAEHNYFYLEGISLKHKDS